jgi:type VI secretion system protein ImpH
VVRFKVHTSMAFPPSSVVALEKGEADTPAAMTVAFLGLLGPARMLPDSYTELAMEQRAFGDESFAAFFDLFHNRLLALYYRAWEKHQFALGREQAGCDRDAMTGYLLDLIGMGTAGLEGQLSFPVEALLRYAGVLAQRPRSAECLRTLLHDYLHVPVAIEQFRGRWHRLENDELTVLGGHERCCQLGEGAAAGDMVWTLQSLIRVVLGPLSAEEFFEFLPDGSRFQEVTGLIRWFLGPTIDFELQPLLAAGVKPKWGALGCVSWSDGERSSRLGWSSWLTASPFVETADDAVFAESELVGAEA